MATMKAWGFKQPGDVEVLEILEVPKPTPLPRDLLVKVHGAALNPVDTKQRILGLYSPPAAVTISGFDGSGVVEAVGSDTKLFKVGDEVYFAGAINRPGCFAEYVAIDERIVAAKPKSLNHRDAAAVPLCALTAWEGMVEGMGIPVPKEGEANPNEKKVILITAGAGGVGSIASQIAKKILKFGTVISTASRPDTINYSKKMGADITIDHTQDYKQELDKLGIAGVDYIMNNIDIWKNVDQLVKVLNPYGKICGITGANKPLDLGSLFMKRGTLVFEFMFARPIYGIDIEKQHEILTNFSKWVDEGIILSRADNVFEFSQMREAQKWQESGSAIGKGVFEVKF